MSFAGLFIMKKYNLVVGSACFLLAYFFFSAVHSVYTTFGCFAVIWCGCKTWQSWSRKTKRKVYTVCGSFKQNILMICYNSLNFFNAKSSGNDIMEIHIVRHSLNTNTFYLSVKYIFLKVKTTRGNKMVQATLEPRKRRVGIIS